MCRLFRTLAVCTAFVLAACPATETTPDSGTPVEETDAGQPKPDAGGDTPDAGHVGVCGAQFEHQYPDGYACNRNEDCANAFCFLNAEGTAAFCTSPCNLDGAGECPEGFVCAAEGAGQFPNICVPDTGSNPLPGDASQPAGAPCNLDADCAGDGAVCAYVQSANLTFCAPSCTSDSDCGECGSCQDFGDGAMYCVPKGDGAIGASCDLPTDCESFICAGASFCTQVCGGTDGIECPSGSSCEPATDTVSVCITDAQRGTKQAGEECAFAFECVTGTKCLSGECTAPKTEGSECASTDECAEGLRCVEDAAGTDRCSPPGQVGARCSTW